MKFRGDNVCKQMLIADNVREMGKIKIWQITEVSRLLDRVIYDVKGQKTSDTNIKS